MKIKELEDYFAQKSNALLADKQQKENALQQKASGFKAKTNQLSDKAKTEGALLKNALAKSGLLKGKSGGIALREERKADNKTKDNIFGLEKELDKNLKETENSLGFNTADYNAKLQGLSQSIESKKAATQSEYQAALQKLYDSLEQQRKTYRANEIKKKIAK